MSSLESGPIFILEKSLCPGKIQTLFLEGEMAVEANLLLRRLAADLSCIMEKIFISPVPIQRRLIDFIFIEEGFNYLLAHGANKDAAEADSGNTALHIAINKRNNSIMELLIKHGAKLDLPNKEGKTALDLSLTPEDPAWAKTFMAALVTKLSQEIFDRYPSAEDPSAEDPSAEETIALKEAQELLEKESNYSVMIKLLSSTAFPAGVPRPFVLNVSVGLHIIWHQLRIAEKMGEALRQNRSGITTSLLLAKLFQILGPTFRGITPRFILFTQKGNMASQHAFLFLVIDDKEKDSTLLCNPLRNLVFQTDYLISRYMGDLSRLHPTFGFYTSNYPSIEKGFPDALTLCTPLLTAVLRTPTCKPEEYIRLLEEFERALSATTPKHVSRLAMSGLRSSASETEAGAGAGSESTASGDEVSAGPGV
jgi:hypothetical protein